jgi:hypothetical protein
MDYHALEKMTVQALRDEAKKFPDVKTVAGMKKEELIHLIAEKLGIEKPQKSTKKHKKATAMDRAAIEAKIISLREERKAARSAKDKKQASLLRRRLHLLKRRLKRVA